MKRVAFIFCVIFAVALAAEEVEIQKYFEICRNSGFEISNECLRDAIQDGVAKLLRGSPEFELPALDPYDTFFEELEYNSGLLNGKVLMKNTKTYGMSQAQILGARSTALEGFHRLEVEVFLPKAFVEGEYKAVNYLNDFQLAGKGLFNVSMDGVRTVWDITGRVENDRWVVEHFRMLPEVENMKIYFDDLFNGNEYMNIAARSFVNEYWPVVYQELLPVAADSWGVQSTKILNRIFSKLSYSKLFARF